jgi:hypothetical protein
MRQVLIKCYSLGRSAPNQPAGVLFIFVTACAIAGVSLKDLFIV